MCAIFLSHFVFAVFWRTLVAFGFVFHHDWFCRLYYLRSAGRSDSVRRLFYGMKDNLIDYPVDAVVFLVRHGRLKHDKRQNQREVVFERIA